VPKAVQIDELGEDFPFDSMVVSEKYLPGERASDYARDVASAIGRLPAVRIRAGWLSRLTRKIFIGDADQVARICADYISAEVAKQQAEWLSVDASLRKLAVFIGTAPMFGKSACALIGLSGGNPGWTMYGAYLCKLSSSEYAYSLRRLPIRE
jgi:hypothetical protein